MTEMMGLVIGWTIVGGFVFTMIITLLSLVGWIKFADRSQQKKLFSTLIVGVVVAAGAGLVGGAKLDFKSVENNLHQEGETKGKLDVVHHFLGSPAAAAVLDKAMLSELVDRIEPKAGTQQELQVRELRQKVDALPSGKLSPDAAKTLRESAVLQPSMRADKMRAVPHSP
jgi:hypothetical protein